MYLLQQTKELCRIYDIKPARSKGQNFLVRSSVYEKIVESADIKKDDIVLEVGPGLGFLTNLLSKKAKKVIAVELDDKLAAVLKTGLDLQEIENVEVINKNILDISPSSFLPAKSSYKIVANLPYNITSVFLRKFLSTKSGLDSMVLMLQKEVAERITAKPGDMSLLAVSIQFYAEPEIIQIVPQDDFWPRPEVGSAVIKIKINSSTKEKIKVDEKNFFRLVKIGFSAKRKMLKNNLANGYHIDQEEAEERLKKAGFSQKVRAQELSVADWISLLSYFE